MKFYKYICYLVLFLPVCSNAQAPIEFIKNEGQWGKWFEYRATTRGADICLEKDGFRYILGDPDNVKKIDAYHHGQTTVSPILNFHVYKVTFEGSNTPTIVGEKQQRNYYNYFLGNDKTYWKSGIHPNLAIDYKELYKGIDMHVSSDRGTMVYEMMVKPGADAKQIKMDFAGPDRMEIKDGNLIINTSVGQVMEMKPYAYQNINNVRTEVACAYHLKGNELTYSLPDGYDPSQLLVIDPTIVFCTFTGSTADNWGYTATYDAQGNFYAGGLVNTFSFGGSYPFSPGAFQTTFGGGYPGASQGGQSLTTYAADIAIMKFNSTGTNRIYATYLGGSGNEHPHSMIVDNNNELIVAGRTRSNDFPITPNAYQTTNHGGWDIIVTKFNDSGTALIGSTYVGGTGDDGVNFDSTEQGYGQLKHNYGDDSRSEVQLDNAGNIYMAGCTNSSDFPTTANALSGTLKGPQDGVVIKLNDNLSSLLWSTYIGGSSWDAGYVLAFDSTQQHLYVAGGTNSSDFPVTAGSYQSTFQGDSADGFVLKFLNTAPYTLTAGTYVGTSGYDQVYGIQTDEENGVYVMGQSIGGTFPVTSGVYSVPNSSQFVMKMDANLATDVFSTVFGNGDGAHSNISPVAFLVDTCHNIYVSGWGGNLGFLNQPTTGDCTGMPTTSNAIQTTTDGRDFYFIILSPNATSLLYATFYGRYSTDPFQGEHVDGGTSRFDKRGVIYEAICGNCAGSYDGLPGSGNQGVGGQDPPLPTTSGVWAPIDQSQNCNEAALKIAFNIGPVSAQALASPSTSGCAPLTVNFINNSVNGISYVWNFGDGSPVDTDYNTSHTFTNPGTYTVSLSAFNSNSCIRVTDTGHLTIVVSSNLIQPAFNYQLLDSCGPYTASFVNTSHDSAGGNNVQYAWSFGDGTTYTGTTPPTHTFPNDTSATYLVTLTMTDTSACNSPDSVTQIIAFNNTRLTAAFTGPDTICQHSSASFVNASVNGQNYNWNFGDGQTSGTANPSHEYDSAGVYTVTLISNNPGACIPVDTFKKVLVVTPTPVANFSSAPVIPVANTPVTFTNTSVNALRYLWDFGDQATSTEVNPSHLYKKTGVYTVCLQAFNNSNCPAKVCKTVSTDIEPNAGIPTAFSPNNDGSNDILYVRGNDIETMDLKIYNRWGQLVFETQDQGTGWDGNFNGKPQPIDAYAYVLNVQFGDGTTFQKKGNVTLLR